MVNTRVLAYLHFFFEKKDIYIFGTANFGMQPKIGECHCPSHSMTRTETLTVSRRVELSGAIAFTTRRTRRGPATVSAQAPHPLWSSEDSDF